MDAKEREKWEQAEKWEREQDARERAEARAEAGKVARQQEEAIAAYHRGKK